MRNERPKHLSFIPHSSFCLLHFSCAILPVKSEDNLVSGDELKATVYLAGEDLFIGVSPGGHAQVLDTNHERSSAATPVELLLIALGSCTAVDVISILRKKREQVTDYRVEVRGERRAEYPRAFTRMEVRHIVRGRNVSEKALAQAI